MSHVKPLAAVGAGRAATVQCQAAAWQAKETRAANLVIKPHLIGGKARVPDEIKRREVELDPHVSPEEIMSREVELGCERWTFSLRVTHLPHVPTSTAVQRTLSLRLCPSTAVETAIAQCTSRWAMARGHRLNTSIVLAAVHGLSGLFSGGIRGRAFTLSPSFPPVPAPNKQPRFGGRKAIWSRERTRPYDYV